jgi:hypothetical protein
MASRYFPFKSLSKIGLYLDIRGMDISKTFVSMTTFIHLHIWSAYALWTIL